MHCQGRNPNRGRRQGTLRSTLKCGWSASHLRGQRFGRLMPLLLLRSFFCADFSLCTRIKSTINISRNSGGNVSGAGRVNNKWTTCHKTCRGQEKGERKGPLDSDGLKKWEQQNKVGEIELIPARSLQRHRSRQRLSLRVCMH